MTELPTQFMSADPANAESTSDNTLNPEFAQARLRIQTIQRFQALNQEIAKISDPQQYEAARAKLDDLALKEYGKVWEVLKRPGVEVFSMMVGGKTKDELKQELITNGCRIGAYANEMLESPDFVTLPQPEQVELVYLTIGDLGFLRSTNIKQLYAKAKELGLELCPPEIGPQYRLQTPDQPRDSHVFVGMPPIAGVDKRPRVFRVDYDEDYRWLYDCIARPRDEWIADNQFLFRLPLLNPEPTEAIHE